jgi:hypothetical protein
MIPMEAAIRKVSGALQLREKTKLEPRCEYDRTAENGRDQFALDTIVNCVWVRRVVAYVRERPQDAPPAPILAPANPEDFVEHGASWDIYFLADEIHELVNWLCYEPEAPRTVEELIKEALLLRPAKIDAIQWVPEYLCRRYPRRVTIPQPRSDRFFLLVDGSPVGKRRLANMISECRK